MQKFIDTLDKFLVENWRSAPKWLSMWIMLLVGLAPQLYDLAVQFQMLDGGTPLPTVFTKALHLIGFAGAVFRLVDQAAITKGLLPAKADSADQAGA